MALIPETPNTYPYQPVRGEEGLLDESARRL